MNFCPVCGTSSASADWRSHHCGNRPDPLRVLKLAGPFIVAVALVWSVFNLLANADEVQRYIDQQICETSRRPACATTTTMP